MLNIKKDRLDYGELLMPPEGYTLNSGIATTYSLDLHTLLAVPVALLYARALEGDFTLENRFDVLDAIQRTDQVLRVYCQKGKIKVPREHNRLFAFLEDAVAEVLPPHPWSSFHPKVWILRFEREKSVIYRLIVLSRNLTFDRSWDVALQMDGEVTAQAIPVNQPLVDLATYLNREAPFPNSKRFLEDLANAAFDGVEAFDTFQFYPIGLDWNADLYPNPLASRSFDRLLVVTPFLDEATLQTLHRICPGHKWLFSREEELKRMAPQTLAGYECYFLNRLIVEGEEYDTLEEETLEAQRQQLHAKIYIGRRDKEYHWLLGSANCTQPAFWRNTEFLIELRGRDYQCSPDKIAAILINAEAKHSFFERYEPVSVPDRTSEEDWETKMRRLEFQLISHSIDGRAIERINQNYDLQLQINLNELVIEETFTVKLAPLNERGEGRKLIPGSPNTLLFENQKLTDLSVFVKITITHEQGLSRQFLSKINIELPEIRKKRIVRQLIDSQDKFFRYLRFLLAESPYDEDTIIPSKKKTHDPPDGDGAGSSAMAFDMPIFEQLLVAASRRPEKLRTINNLIDRIRAEEENEQTAVIPQEFIDFWEVFQPLIPDQ